MSEPSPSWIKDVWEILQSKTSIRPMIATAFLAGAVLFLPRCWLSKIHMSDWVAHFWPWILVSFSFCVVMLLIHATEAVAKPLITSRRVAQRFADLADDEKQMLQRFLVANVSSLTMWSHEAGVGTLLADGLLNQTSHADLGNGMFAYSLTPACRKQLKKRNNKI